MKCIILAGGYATRLWPLTKETPKPLIKIGNKTVLELILEKIKDLDINQIILSSNIKFKNIFSEFIKNLNYKILIKQIWDETTCEKEKYGPLKALDNIIKKENINDNIVIINGDNVFEFDLKDIIDFFNKKNKIVLGISDLRHLHRVSALGVVKLGNENKIISFVEKPKFPTSTTVCTGIYLIPKDNLNIFDEYIKNNGAKDKIGNLLEWACDKKNILGYLLEGVWFDIGTEESLIEAKKFFGDEKKTVLVTGGLGYLGWNVTNTLINKNYNVKILDSSLYDFEPDNKIKFVKGDIRNKEDVKKALKDCDYVIHLAALSNDPLCEVNPELGIEINYNGTKNVVDLAKKLGIKRFIFPSSCSIYGNSGGKEVDEESKTKPLTLYAQTKLAAESYIKKQTDDDFDTVILRLATLFGYSKHMRFDLIANIICVEGAYDKEIKLFGGSQYRPLLHVQDAAEAIVTSLEHKDKLKGNVFNVGSNEDNYTTKELTLKIKNNIFPDINIKEFQENVDIRSYQVKFDKINKHLNYYTKINVINGSKQIADSIYKGEFKNPRDEQYFRVKYLLKKKLI